MLAFSRTWAKRGNQVYKMKLIRELTVMLVLALNLSAATDAGLPAMMAKLQYGWNFDWQGGKPPEKTRERDKEPAKPDRRPPPRDERRDNKRPSDSNQ